MIFKTQTIFITSTGESKMYSTLLWYKEADRTLLHLHF